MRRSLMPVAAALLIAGCRDDSSSDKESSKPNEARTETTATIQGCAPQCLHRNYTEPGRVPKSAYKAQPFFAGRMSVVFDRGWSVGEDSDGEFSSAEYRPPDLPVIF